MSRTRHLQRDSDLNSLDLFLLHILLPAVVEIRRMAELCPAMSCAVSNAAPQST